MIRLAVAVFAIVGLAHLAAAQTPQSDPVSVLKRLFEARNSADSEAAAALFDRDGVIVNVVGTRFAGRDDIRRFMETAAAQKGTYDLEQVSLAGEILTWTDLVTNPVYEKLGIAPVQVAGEAVIREGKIESFVTHFPPTSLAKFEQVCEPACETAKADGVLIVGLLCPQFLVKAKAQMRSARSR
jgi:membrane-associated protease RseP (regulator of RpoE activity)